MAPISSWGEVGSILQSFVTVAAIVVGGLWTYFLFIRQRLAFPRLQVSIAPHPVRISGGWIIHAAIQLTNSGSVLVCVRSAEIRLRTVLPLPEEVRAAVAEGYDPVAEGEAEIPWPMLAGRRWDWKTSPIEIEPGETDTLHADFFVPQEVSVVQFYLYVANAKKKRSALGWTITMIYTMPNREVSPMTNLDERKRIKKHQRQQKQQKPQQPTQPKQGKNQSSQQGKNK